MLTQRESALGVISTTHLPVLVFQKTRRFVGCKLLKLRCRNCLPWPSQNHQFAVRSQPEIDLPWGLAPQVERNGPVRACRKRVACMACLGVAALPQRPPAEHTRRNVAP